MVVQWRTFVAARQLSRVKEMLSTRVGELTAELAAADEEHAAHAATAVVENAAREAAAEEDYAARAAVAEEGYAVRAAAADADIATFKYRSEIAEAAISDLEARAVGSDAAAAAAAGAAAAAASCRADTAEAAAAAAADAADAANARADAAEAVTTAVITRATSAAAAAAAEAGTSRHRPLHHPTRVAPWCLELKASHDVASIICHALRRGGHRGSTKRHRRRRCRHRE